jgi:hypothetical protein
VGLRRHCCCPSDELLLVRHIVLPCTTPRPLVANDAAFSHPSAPFPMSCSRFQILSRLADLSCLLHAATWGPGSKGGKGNRLQTYTATKLPPLLAVEEFPALGLRLAIHQRLGIDHLRTGKPTEDVVLHQCPCEPFGADAALFCVFDGHSGSQAAQRAKAIVPGVLASKLMVGCDLYCYHPPMLVAVWCFLSPVIVVCCSSFVT